MQDGHHSLLLKTFVFENEAGSNSQNLEVSLSTDMETIDIHRIISIWRHKNGVRQPMEFKIYDPEINRYVVLDLERPISKSFLYSPVIMVKYKELSGTMDNEDIWSLPSSKMSTESKRERNRERTIQEVLEYVKQWRQIHNTLDRYRNKINLQQAAKMVGISKKSLDDYYCQLRLAEEYGFDFQTNIWQKIGVLRAFVKAHRPRGGDQGIKHQRLPKKLRILQQVGANRSLRQKMQQQEMRVQDEQQSVQPLLEAQYEPPLPIIPEDEYQSRFYNSFSFMLNEPQDPFMVLGRRAAGEANNWSQLPLF